MKWTEEQKKIIEIRNKNILVSAAAGSGKTAVLVERIKNLIIGDRIPLKSMLIVTFTNAAAGEMKQRIIDSIDKELIKKDDDFLREQIQNIYNTHISTFHAFAISILKRYYHIAGIEPSFNICPESKLELYRNEALDELLESEFKVSDPEFIGFMNDYATSKSEDAVRTMILKTYDFIQTIPDSEEWLEMSVENLNISPEEFTDTQVFKRLKDQINYNLERGLKKNEALTDYLRENGITSLESKAGKDSLEIKNLINTLNQNSFDIFLGNLYDLKYQRFVVSKEEKEDYEKIKDTVTKKRNSIKKDIDYSKSLFLNGDLRSRVKEINETYPSAIVLKRLVLKFSRIFSEIKKKEDVLDFNDVEHLALKILKNEDVSDEYRKKFNYIFIDEYQDSNYIQEAFIERIKRDNNLFMVGDVKQSIYKFRRAEPSIFISKYDKYGSEGNETCCRIDLNKNFRSKTNIIECINDTFAHIMEEKLSKMNYDEKAYLYKGLDYETRWDIPVDFHVIDSCKSENEQEADEKINEIIEAELEAHKIAEVIKNEIGKPIFDVKKNEERPLEYRDIVILLRAVKNNASSIYEILMNHGIPTFSEGGEDYFSTVEIETFLNLLKVIDNRRQDVPLVSAMYSPVFGFTTEELIKIRLIKKTGNYYTAFLNYIDDGPDEDLRKKCLETHMQIDKWKRDESFMSLDDFLWMLMNESGYYNYAGALIGGEQRRANLRALIDRASDYTSGKIRGLYGFIKYIETISKNDIKMGQIKLLSENDNVVRITSVHKSKGLEYPYVILARLGKNFNRSSNRSKVRLDKDMGLALQWENYALKAYKKTLLMRIVEEKSYVEELAEEIRVLYVAMTRAMDKLVLVGSVNTKGEDIQKMLDQCSEMNLKRDLDIKSAKSYLDLLLPIAFKTGITPIISRREDILSALDSELATKKVRENISVRIKDISEKTNDSGNPDDSIRREVKRRLSFEYPNKKALALKSKYSVTQLNHIDKVPEKIMTYGTGDDRISDLVPDFMAGEIKMSSSEKGTVLHTVLEKLDFKEAYANRGDPDYLNEFLNILASKEILTTQQIESVSLYALRSFIHSDIMKKAIKADKIEKERPFNIVREIDGEKIVVQGIIDCYFETDGKYTLIDYKSNYVNREDPDDKNRIKSMYEMQIDIYRDALETVTGKEVKEAYLYLTRIGEALEIPRKDRFSKVQLSDSSDN